MAIFEEVKQVRQTIKKQIITYISAGFGFVTGLAWNDAIKGFIAFVFPEDSDSVVVQFVYAILITLVTATLVYYLQKLIAEKKQ